MTPSAKRFILEQLETHRNMSLATVRPDGYPQATTVAYALLARKFKEMKGLSAQDLAATAFVRVQPKVVSMLDYRRGFGWTKQVRV
jgi:hypothetical protein